MLAILWTDKTKDLNFSFFENYFYALCCYLNTNLIKVDSIEQLSSIEKHGSLGGKFFQASVIIIDYINGFLFINFISALFSFNSSRLINDRFFVFPGLFYPSLCLSRRQLRFT